MKEKEREFRLTIKKKKGKEVKRMTVKNGSISVFAIIEGIPSNGRKIPLVREKKDAYKNQNMDSLWKLPGGKMDPNEYPELTAIREINEEVGINIFPPKENDIIFSREMNDCHTFLVYRADYYGGELRAGDEIAEIKLFSPEEIELMIIGEKLLTNHAAALKEYLKI